MKSATFVIVLAMVALPCFADKEALSHAVVFTSDSGLYYVKSVPESPYKQTAGVTKVYRVTSDQDELVCEYQWYARQLWLHWDGTNLILVRRGPWHRAGNPPEQEIEIGFYKDGNVIKEYTAADIAKDENSYARSVSHYMVTSRAKGIVAGEQGTYFQIGTMDGRSDLRFDIYTGEPMKEQAAPAKKAAEPTLGADQARRALVELVKAHPRIFVSTGMAESAEAVESARVDARTTGQVGISRFIVNLDAKGYVQCHALHSPYLGIREDWVWSGSFVRTPEGEWRAETPTDFQRVWHKNNKGHDQ